MSAFRITTAILSLSAFLVGCNSNNSQSSSSALPSEYNIGTYTPQENSTDYTGTWVLVISESSTEIADDDGKKVEWSQNKSTREFVQVREEDGKYYLTQCIYHEREINIENNQISFLGYNLTGQNYNYFYGDNPDSKGYMTMVKLSENLDPLGTMIIEETGKPKSTYDLNAVCYDLNNFVDADGNNSGSSIDRTFQVKLPDSDEGGNLSNVQLVSDPSSSNTSTTMYIGFSHNDGPAGIGIQSYSEDVIYDFPVDSHFEISGSISTASLKIDIAVDITHN